MTLPFESRTILLLLLLLEVGGLLLRPLFGGGVSVSIGSSVGLFGASATCAYDCDATFSRLWRRTDLLLLLFDELLLWLLCRSELLLSLFCRPLLLL